MKAVQLKSGLVVPKNAVEKPPEPPQKNYGLLEVKDEESRKFITDVLTSMRNNVHICGRAGGIVFADTGQIVLRQNMIMLLGKALLGEDWNPEVKC